MSSSSLRPRAFIGTTKNVTTPALDFSTFIPGGTAQGIRIARALHIPVYDLSTEEGREGVRELL